MALTHSYHFRLKENKFNWETFYWLINSETISCKCLFFLSQGLDVPCDKEELEQMYGSIDDGNIFLDAISIDYYDGPDLLKNELVLSIKLTYEDSDEGRENIARLGSMFRDLTIGDDDDIMDEVGSLLEVGGISRQKIAYLWKEATYARRDGLIAEVGRTQWQMSIDPYWMYGHLERSSWSRSV